MDIKFSFDEAAFKRAIRGSATAALEDIAARVQDLFDDVYTSRHGQPSAVVADSLRAGAARSDLNFTNEQIQYYAEAISEGRHIRVEVDSSSLG